MRVSFLVLLASLCLSAVYAATPGKKMAAVDAVKAGDVIEEEEVIVTRTSTEGKRKGRRKKENWEPKPVVQVPCDQLLVSEKNECVPAADNQVCNFFILNEENCAFECRCETKIQEVVEEVVEEENGASGATLVKNKRKRKKEGAEAGEKVGRKKQAGGKECAGEKKLSWSNCLIKMKGLIAWGENTANFEQKWSASK